MKHTERLSETMRAFWSYVRWSKTKKGKFLLSKPLFDMEAYVAGWHAARAADTTEISLRPPQDRPRTPDA